MELLFDSGIVSISDWKYTKSVSVKIKSSWLVPAVTYWFHDRVHIGWSLQLHIGFMTGFILAGPYWFHNRVSRLLNLHYCDCSAKDVADWYRHNTMYYVCYIV